MAVLLEKLYFETSQKYQLKLVAGEKGIYNLVDWVNIVENINLISFQRQKELVISTGVANHEADGLLSFCRQLKNNEISGLIINIGPYIKSIPKEIISYCNESAFPLFVLPWEIRLADIMHDMCVLILKQEQLENIFFETIQNAIFFPEENDVYKKMLSKIGFGADTRYCMAALSLRSASEIDVEYDISSIKGDMIQSFCRINNAFVLSLHDKRMYIVFANYKSSEMKLAKQKLQDLQQANLAKFRLYAVISPQNLQIEELNDYYKKLNIMLKLAVHKDCLIIEYEEEDIYKLLLAECSPKANRDFFNKTYGCLVEYDRMNQTKYCMLLKQYFEMNGNIQKVAGLNYVHRNTINYQLKKIEKICNVDLENWNDRLKMHLSIFISDLL